MNLRFWLLSTAIFLAGCTSVRIAGETDPEAYPLRRVLVHAEAEDLALRQQIERSLTEALRKRHVEAEMSLEKVPATRSVADWPRWARQSGYDAYLHVIVRERGQQFKPTYTRVDTRVENSRRTTTVIEQTGSVRDYALLEARLIETSEQRTFWVGSVLTRSNMQTSGVLTSPDHDLQLALKDAAKRLAKELTQKHKLLQASR
ncbi:hypothetical protein [Rhodothermus bifroesti]|uniref:hypothetical protein n=1 Tax=Rhodothermus bifroesti TaxID=2823335 RepID=UPI001AEFF27B|nr:hypothetical protein [Rhodothermus bifroesti]